MVYLIWILIIRAIFTEMLPFKQDCGFDLDVSVSRQSRDTLRPRSHLGWIGKRLGLSQNKGSRSWTVRPRAQVIVTHML